MSADEKPPRPPLDPDHAQDAGVDLNVSRRSFLKTVGVTSVASTLLAPATAEAQGARAVGPGEVAVQLTINGKRHDLKIEPRVTLLDAVRNRLDITGVKRVCDRGACGACTMIVDGRTIYACSTLAIEMQGKAIRTIEGLTTGTVLHPVQQAFCDTDGLMCGFCTPGFVMATVALLEKNPNPTPMQARAALDGNICRCGTYVRVLEAALTTKGVRRA
jgi:xanthine dehydrogenase YagT iron-sulfur-binding subunit